MANVEPSPKRLRTLPVATSSIMERLINFLPKMAEANKFLSDGELSVLDDDLEPVTCEDENVSLVFVVK